MQLILEEEGLNMNASFEHLGKTLMNTISHFLNSFTEFKNKSWWL
jgi:hypothetical protein